MPTQKEKEKIHTLAKQGKSINQITKQLELPKSTVYYYFKKAVGQKQKENQPIIPKNPKIQGELCGIFAGDGNFHKTKAGHYRIRIFLNLNEEYWKVLANFLEKELARRPHVYTYEDKSRATLDYSSKKLYEFFKENLQWKEDKTKTICLNKDENLSENFKIGFLRGLLDTDGYTSKLTRRSVFNTISLNLSKDTSSILTDLGLEHYTRTDVDKRENYQDMHRVGVTGNEAIELTEIIEPRNPIKKCKFARL